MSDLFSGAPTGASGTDSKRRIMTKYLLCRGASPLITTAYKKNIHPRSTLVIMKGGDKVFDFTPGTGAFWHLFSDSRHPNHHPIKPGFKPRRQRVLHQPRIKLVADMGQNHARRADNLIQRKHGI